MPFVQGIVNIRLSGWRTVSLRTKETFLHPLGLFIFAKQPTITISEACSYPLEVEVVR